MRRRCVVTKKPYRHVVCGTETTYLCIVYAGREPVCVCPKPMLEGAKMIGKGAFPRARQTVKECIP